jgi:hypothetical protein
MISHFPNNQLYQAFSVCAIHPFQGKTGRKLNLMFHYCELSFTDLTMVVTRMPLGREASHFMRLSWASSTKIAKRAKADMSCPTARHRPLKERQWRSR